MVFDKFSRLLRRWVRAPERERDLAYLAAIVQSTDDAIVGKDLGGIVTSWNPAAETMFGYRAAEMINRPITVIIPPELISEETEFLARIRRGERVDHVETIRRRKDGRELPVSLTISPIRDRDGAVIGASKIARDISDRRAVEEKLRQSEAKFRSLFTDNPLPMWAFDRTTLEFVEVNHAAVARYGYSPAEFAAMRVTDIRPPEDVAAFLGTLTVSRPADRRAGRWRHRLRDGSLIDVEITAHDMELAGRSVILAVPVDVTERIAAEEKVRQTHKLEAVGQLTGGVAHDFNNILTVITGTIDILADAVADRPKLAAIARMISEAADRGTELTQRLLAFARKQPLQPRRTDVNALIVDTARLLRPALGEHVEIESMLKPDLWPALVDASQLSTTLLNLAVNARDAMPDGGKLTLESDNVVLDKSYAADNPDVRPGPYVLIAVSDTGSGIPAEIRDKVFEPFFTTKEVGKGTGLGLSMVYGFVKQSDGHIKIYSEEGQGTSVKLYFPRTGELSESATDALAAGPLPTGGECILVVEDDTLVRDYVIAQLASLGYGTLAARSGIEALELVDRGAMFDLLFTDVIMPGMNGRQLAEEVRKRQPAIRVLYTSGYTENAILHHGRLDPDVILLAKPYRKADLARMIRVALETGSRPTA